MALHTAHSALSCPNASGATSAPQGSCKKETTHWVRANARASTLTTNAYKCLTSTFIRIPSITSSCLPCRVSAPATSQRGFSSGERI